MQEMQLDNLVLTYVRSVEHRLHAEGFQCTENLFYAGQVFTAVGRKAGFEISKFGEFERFFVLQHLPAIDPYSLRRFSSHCFNYATSNRRSSLPLGFFSSLACYAVAVIHTVDQAAAFAVSNEEPPMHLTGFEFPVIYELATRMLYYSTKTPFFGWAYYNGLRKEAHRLLSF